MSSFYTDGLWWTTGFNMVESESEQLSISSCSQNTAIWFLLLNLTSSSTLSRNMNMKYRATAERTCHTCEIWYVFETHWSYCSQSPIRLAGSILWWWRGWWDDKVVISRGAKTDIVARVEVKEDARPVHLPEHCHRHDLVFEMLYHHCDNLLIAGERSVVFSLLAKK